MEFEQPVSINRVPLKRLQTAFSCLAVALLTFSLGSIYTHILQRQNPPVCWTHWRNYPNQVPSDRPHTRILPPKVYNKATGQWEVEKPKGVLSFDEGL
jgi:hypothetical protein